MEYGLLLLPMIALVYLTLRLYLLAPRKPGYSHLRHTISELGETGSPVQNVVAWRVFLPVGLLLLPIAVVYQSAAPAVSSLAACVAAGYVVAALFPCDAGSPVSGSWRQGVHNLGGAVEYIGGGFSLHWASERFGEPLGWVGFASLGAAFLLTVVPTSGPRGAIQRVAEIGLFGALAYLAWAVAAGR